MRDHSLVVSRLRLWYCLSQYYWRLPYQILRFPVLRDVTKLYCDGNRHQHYLAVAISTSLWYSL